MLGLLINGDLISETITVIEPPMTDVRLTVSELESCDAPHAGGFVYNKITSAS